LMRLFAALPLAAEVVDGLSQLSSRLQSQGWPVRWVRPAGLHLTLRFYGTVDPAGAERLAESLDAAAAGTSPIPLSLSGLGVFPGPRRPRVLWIGVAPVPALELLQHRVETAALAHGFEGERTTFRPHVTLGRVKRGSRLPPGAVTQLDGLTAEFGCLAQSLVLYRSDPGPGGPSYNSIHTVALEESWAA